MAKKEYDVVLVDTNHILDEINLQAKLNDIELIGGNGLTNIADTQQFYIKDNKLVRYIDEAGNIVNNPTATEILKMADHAINEAY